MVGEGSSVRTRPSPGTGYKSSGGRGRRFVKIGLSPVFSSPSARWSVGGSQMRDSRSHSGGRRRPSRRLSSGMPKYRNTWLNRFSAVSMALKGEKTTTLRESIHND